MGLLGLNDLKLKLERYCAYQDRCTQDVLQKIKKIGIEDSEKIKITLHHLESLGFIDDSRFVNSFISGKVSIKKWGVNKIKSSLFEKRLDCELIDRGLNKIDKSLYEKNLRSLFEKKSKELTGFETDFTKKSKIIRYLSGKGYTTEEINRCF